MAGWSEKLGNWFSAVAFAEAGEHKAALEMVGLAPGEAKQRSSLMQTLDSVFAAGAFAEENCHDTARQILGLENRKGSFLETVGLGGIRVWYGTARLAEESFLEAVGLKGAPVRLGLVPL